MGRENYVSTHPCHLFARIVAVKELHYLHLPLPNSVSQDLGKLDQGSSQLLLLPLPHEPHPSRSHAPRLRSLVEAQGQVVCAELEHFGALRYLGIAVRPRRVLPSQRYHFGRTPPACNQPASRHPRGSGVGEMSQHVTGKLRMQTYTMLLALPRLRPYHARKACPSPLAEARE